MNIRQAFCKHRFAVDWYGAAYMSEGDRFNKIPSGELICVCRDCGKEVRAYDKWFRKTDPDGKYGKKAE